MKIEAIGLGKEFTLGARRLSVLQDVNVAIAHRRFACLLGPSGCGKSTFLRCVAGLDRPTTGRILLDGAPVRGPGPDRSMVFQDYALFPWYTVAQNIQFGLTVRRNRRLRGRAPEEVTAELVGLVGLQGFEHAFPHQISGGMRQRVGLARALAVDPGALLMDEPFAAIDAITREGLQRQLVEVWARTHKTVLFVTHSVDEAAYLGDEVHVFGPRPASIRETVAIDLPRPRNKEAPEFIAILAHLRRSIDEAMRGAEETAA
jgi:NitT/TauT family transport system ATP-binding protein